MNFNNNNNKSKLWVVLLIMAGFSACTGDLVKMPTNDLTADSQFKTAGGYKQSMASIYSNTAMVGQFWKSIWVAPVPKILKQISATRQSILPKGFEGSGKFLNT